MGITEEAGKVGTAAVGAMASTPLAIALLIVNIGFLGFSGYILGEVAEGARVRNETQMNLIEKLVTDIRDCRAGPRPGVWIPPEYPPSFTDINSVTPP